MHKVSVQFAPPSADTMRELGAWKEAFDFGHLLTTRQPEINRHFNGKLTDVRYRGKRLEIISDATGVSYREQP